MIRIAREQDIPAMLEIYAPYVENTTYSFEYDVSCRKTFTQRFFAITAQFPWLVWEEEGKILGYAYGSPPFERAAYRWCAEDSIYLLPEAQGRGIGTRLCRALVRSGLYPAVYPAIWATQVVRRKLGEAAFRLRATLLKAPSMI